MLLYCDCDCIPFLLLNYGINFITFLLFRMKRFFGDKDDRTPAVEKLYKKNQQSYATSGGFDADDDYLEERRERISEAIQKKRDRPFEHLLAPDNCVECDGALFSDSFLWNKFNYPACDQCRDDSGKHKLIARTEAKEKYLLKDCDLDLRKPQLRFISKKNPHNPRYGDMKLYLKAQLELRALDLYGSFEKLEEARKLRECNRELMTEKRFEQKIRRMRKEIRGNTYETAKAASIHQHKFGEEQLDEKNGEYWKRCLICEYEMRYEKL